MICLGLALSTVGLDLISGQPRLIFGDMPGFYSGISFLVLAIGTYGLGEILYTIETSKTAPTVTNARITFAELGAGLKRMNSLWKTMSRFIPWVSWVCCPRRGQPCGADVLWDCKTDIKNI